MGYGITVCHELKSGNEKHIPWCIAADLKKIFNFLCKCLNSFAAVEHIFIIYPINSSMFSFD